MLTHTEMETIAKLMAERILAERPIVGRWLTIEEAMAYAKVKSRMTITAWINKGYIYAHKRTGSWIVDRETIDDWFSSAK